MGPVGWQEMMFIFLLALVIFGPKKLPELGRNLAKALTEFRKASNELKATFDRELISLEREHESIKEATSNYLSDTYSSNSSSESSYNYDYDSSYYDSGSTGEVQSSESHDSTAANSSSVSEPATQGAESTEAHEGAVVAQETGSEASSNNGHPADSAPHAELEPAKPVSAP